MDPVLNQSANQSSQPFDKSGRDATTISTTQKEVSIAFGSREHNSSWPVSRFGQTISDRTETHRLTISWAHVDSEHPIGREGAATKDEWDSDWQKSTTVRFVQYFSDRYLTNELRRSKGEQPSLAEWLSFPFSYAGSKSWL